MNIVFVGRFGNELDFAGSEGLVNMNIDNIKPQQIPSSSLSTSEEPVGGTSGFLVKVQLRVLQCGMKVDNIKPQVIVWFPVSGRLLNSDCALGHQSFEMSFSFTDQLHLPALGEAVDAGTS